MSSASMPDADTNVCPLLPKYRLLVWVAVTEPETEAPYDNILQIEVRVTALALVMTLAPKRKDANDGEAVIAVVPVRVHV